MQIISTDKFVRTFTIQVLKEINNQSLATQAEKGEQLFSKMPAIKEAFNLLGDYIDELSKKNETLKNKIGSYDKKCPKESTANLLEQFSDEKKASLIMSRTRKQMEKH